MRQLTGGMAVLAGASLAFAATACNKGPAEVALQEVDQALVAARPELERYAPEELASLTAAAREARAELDMGNYTDALRAAQTLPARIRTAVEAAKARKDELAAGWNEMTGGLPELVERITARVAELAAAKTLPKGIDGAAVASAQTDLAAVSQAWSEATAAFQGGDVARAVTTAQNVKAKAEALAERLGLVPAPAASPTAGAVAH
jgi:hypothetical protein